MTSISDLTKPDLGGKGDGFIEAEVVSKTEAAHSTSPGILLCPGVLHQLAVHDGETTMGFCIFFSPFGIIT